MTTRVGSAAWNRTGTNAQETVETGLDDLL